MATNDMTDPQVDINDLEPIKEVKGGATAPKAKDQSKLVDDNHGKNVSPPPAERSGAGY